MKINDIYSYDNSSISGNPGIDDAGFAAGNVKAGDIIEGVVTSVGKNPTVLFEDLNNRELSFDKSAVRNAHVGQKRSFEVVEASKDRIVLRDLGEAGAEIAAKGIIAAKVDMGMPKMVEDFEKANGTEEEEDTDSIRRLSDEDYSELAVEGFSIEDYKAERLVRALARIKAQRAAGRENIREQSEKLKDGREAVRKQAAKAAADKYASYGNIIEALEQADLPLTEENIAQIAAATDMSSAAVRMNDNSFAYLIGNRLEPTIDNIYRAVYSGSIKRVPISPEDWKSLEPAAREITAEANRLISETEYEDGQPQNADTADARWLLEYELPLDETNLVYKKELEELKNDGRDADKVARAAAHTIEQGGEAKDALLIGNRKRNSENGNGQGGNESNPRDTVEQLTARLRLQEIRLSMAASSDGRVKGIVTATDLSGIQEQIEALRAEIKSFYNELAAEIGITDENAAELATETTVAAENIAEAPVTLYGATFTSRAFITLGELSDAAITLAGREDEEMRIAPRKIMSGAIGSYEASATEVRKDLGDSIRKAFGNVGELIADTGLELSEANRRAVRILGYNSMEITAENIESIKYYDARVTAMLKGLKPAIVMSMIKRGYNPLEQDIDTVNREIDEILAEEGPSSEERFSSFLVRTEASEKISENARNAYIGIYRLIYQIEKTDGAVLGAAIGSGRELTLKNLLTEARTRSGKGIDTVAEDDTPVAVTTYANSITGQIDKAFEGIRQERFEYNMRLAKQISEITGPEVWEEAAAPDELEELTPEQLFERLNSAEQAIPDNTVSAEAARIRSVMASQTSSRKFLKSLGIDDSVNNIEIMDAESDETALDFGNVRELLESTEQPEMLADRYLEAERQAERRLQDSLLGDRNAMSQAGTLTAMLGRYRLLSDMARGGHYRMRLGGETPARINLTLIHRAESAGSLSLEIGTSQYHVHAELKVTVNGQGTAAGGRIEGTVSCDGTDELTEISRQVGSFVEAVGRLGFDASGITKTVDRISPDRYFGRLSGQKSAVQSEASAKEEAGYKASTTRLCKIAKEFIASFFEI